MTKQLLISQHQVTALCRGAGKAGYVPELLIGTIVVRLVPESIALADLLGQKAGDQKDEREFKYWDGPELGQHETSVPETLIKEDGRLRHASSIKGAGPATVKRLIELGLVELEDGAREFHRSLQIRTTAHGLTHFKRREAHYEKYWAL